MERKLIDVALVFETMDAMVTEAKESGGKGLLGLLRDRLVFFLIYSLTLRVREVLALDTGAFTTGKKSARGKGLLRLQFDTKFWRHGNLSIPVPGDKIPAMLDRYLKEVRPLLLRTAGQDESALFLSERGARLSYPALVSSFGRVLARAGLEEEGHTLRSLRFTGIYRMCTAMQPDWNYPCVAGNPLATRRWFQLSDDEMEILFVRYFPDLYERSEP